MLYFEKEPAVFCPPLCFALALAAGFYPVFIPRIFVLAAAAGAAAPAIVLLGYSRRFSCRGPRLHSLLFSAAACGLALGLCLRMAEAGRAPRWPAPEAAAALACPAVQPEAAGGRAAESRLKRLRIVGIQGRLRSDSSPASGGYRSYPLRVEAFVFRADGIRGEYSGRTELALFSQDGEALEAGAPVECSGRLVLPEAGSGRAAVFFADRGLIAADGRILPAAAADPGRSLDWRGADRGRSRRRGGGSGTSVAPRDLREFRARTRQSFRTALRAAGGREAGGLFEALLLGCRDDLDIEDAANFKNAGCAHILALSGQHLAILAAAICFLLKPLLGVRRARIGALAIAVFFIFIAGPGPSLLRAVLMYALSAAAFFLDRPQSSLTILALAFIITTSGDPESSRSLSYVLSYLALFGLAALGPSFERLLASWLPPKLAAGLAASLAAQAATGPVSALVFGSLHPAGIAAALVSGPLVAAFIWWGLGAGIVAGLIPAAAPWLSPVSTLIYRLLRGTMAFFARWPAIELSPDSRGFAAALVAVFAAFVYALPYAEHFAIKARAGRSARANHRALRQTSL